MSVCKTACQIKEWSGCGTVEVGASFMQRTRPIGTTATAVA
jgi:hypothetical protein